MPPFRRVAVFCGSSSRVRPAFLEAAATTRRLLAERGAGVVYGGGNIGLMGAVAQAALDAGGEVIGVITHRIQSLEIKHPDLTDLYMVEGMHARKTMMMNLSDAIVGLPGGYGTLEEVFEAVTWSQLNIHRKPVGFLDLEGYYSGLFDLIDRAVDERFIRPMHRAMIARAVTPEALLDALEGVRVPLLSEWSRTIGERM